MKPRKLQLERLDPRRLLAVYTPAAEVTDGDAASLRAAIVDAQANNQDDTIRLGEGVYRITQGDMRVHEAGKLLEIIGAGPQETIIVIEGDSRWLDVDFDAIVDLSGVTVLGGDADEGGQVRNAGNLTISDARLQAGRARLGGSILNGGKVQLTSVQLVGNTAGWGGAVWNHAGASVVAEETIFSANRAERTNTTGIDDVSDEPDSLGYSIASNVHWNALDQGAADTFSQPHGAAIYNAGDWQAARMEVTGNSGGLSAISNFGSDSDLVLDHWIAHDNRTSVLLNAFGTATVTRSDIFDNSRATGALLWNHKGSIDLFDVDVFNNSAQVQAQAVANQHGQLRLEQVRIVGNHTGSARNYHIDTGSGTGVGHPVAFMGMIQYGKAYLEMTDTTIDNNGQMVGYRVADSPGDDDDFSAENLTFAIRPANLAIIGEFRSGGGNRIGAKIVKVNVKELPPIVDIEVDDVYLPEAEDGAIQETFGIDVSTLYPPGISRHSITPELSVQEDSGEVRLAGPRDVTAVFAGLGNVSLTGDGTIVYRPADDWFGVESISYLDAAGGLHSYAVEVLPLPDAPVTASDHATVLGRTEMRGYDFKHSGLTPQELEAKFAEHGINARGLFDPKDRNRAAISIPVTTNDSPGTADNLWIEVTDVGSADHGEVSLPKGARPQHVDYTPAPGFAGTDSFTYTITNADGLTATETVTVEVLDPQQHPKLGRVTAEIVDANGDSVTRVRRGDTFFVEASINYTGGLFHPLTNRRYFYMAAAGLVIQGEGVRIAQTHTLDSGQVQRIRPKALHPYSLDFGAAAPFINQRDSSTLLVAPKSALWEPTVAGQDAFYRIPVVADRIGPLTVDVNTSLGEFSRLAGYGGDVPHDWISQIGDSVEVVSDYMNMDRPEDVNQDDSVSAVDALIVINALGRQHSGGQVDGEITSSVEADASHLWDVDGNGELTALDALRVINRISREHAATAATAGLQPEDDEETLPHEPGLSTLESEAVDKVFSAS